MSGKKEKIERLAAIIARDMGEGLFGRTEEYAARVGELFAAAVDALTRLASGTDLDAATEVFRFSDNKRMSAKATAILRGLYSAVYQEVRNAVLTEWENANAATDRLVEAALGIGGGGGGAQIAQATGHGGKYARLFARNREAVDVFFNRKSEYGGLNLSQRVWQYTGQLKEEMELALSVSLGRGDSAATVSRKVRQYLREPERLFRRVRDEDGNLKLSKAAAAYHPGRGVYRSSYKNAMRMTRTEVNAAYRAADCDRWGGIPFIVGVEVRRSNHPFACSVCEALAGKYPKDFKFVGWHPQCRCYIVPVLASEKERMAYHKAILNGEDVEGWKFEGEIAEPHAGFQKWMNDNAERVERARERGTLPYWVKDNDKYVGAAAKPQPTGKGAKDIHDQRDTMSPELRARIDLHNERAREYKRLVDDPDYKDVEFNEENAGVKATHKDHKLHENDEKRYFAERLNGDELEAEFQQLAFSLGHSVIFRAEAENVTDLDMILDGTKMDLVSVTENSDTFKNQLRRKNTQIAKYNALHSEENETLCMYFHEPSYYSESKIRDGISKLRDFGINIHIRNVWVLLNDGSDMFKVTI